MLLFPPKRENITLNQYSTDKDVHNDTPKYLLVQNMQGYVKLLATDRIILNDGQVTVTSPKPAPQTSTPQQGPKVLYVRLRFSRSEASDRMAIVTTLKTKTSDVAVYLPKTLITPVFFWLADALHPIGGRNVCCDTTLGWGERYKRKIINYEGCVNFGFRLPYISFVFFKGEFFRQRWSKQHVTCNDYRGVLKP
ncbi:hypothetical protein TNCV_1871241 [Trichonephila clavipes]|nr:hypothetical protein TNCV_1871241 [Trichonephila clavipes]